MTSIEIPAGLTTIGSSAFKNCSKLAKITMPASVTSIQTTAFSGCTFKTAGPVGSGCDYEYSWTKIPNNAFYQCSYLTSVIIPAYVTDIGSSAFNGCKLKYVFYGGDETAWEGVFIGASNTPLTNAFIHYEATDHTWNEGTVTKEASCTEPGAKDFACTVEKCDGAKTEVIPVSDHNYSEEWTVDTPATCTEPGSKSHHCTNCDAKTDVTEIPAAGHSWDEGTVTKEATCEEAGVKTFTCTAEDCSETKTEEIPAPGHDMETIQGKPATFTEDGNTEATICKNCGQGS
ncbi:MAG: leucine-rich repeat domain-containing protein, partial [Parasporobacterium sp.]|nr:leucine-rich repeat domain-containing protein [Parasporobacterium sp.]